MSRMLTAALILSLVAPGAFAAPGGSMIEISDREVIKAEAVFNSPFYAAHSEEIRARAKQMLAEAGDDIIDAEMRDRVNREIDELPFHRIIDIELVPFLGFPDTLAVCLEGHPVAGLAIEACAGATIFITSLSANVKYRWDLLLRETAKGDFHELELGPGAGIRYFNVCFFECQDGLMLEAMASLEYTYWMSKHFGFTAQLDLGASYLAFQPGNEANVGTVLPYGKISIGVAF